MSRKFITDREIAFINQVNKELLQQVIGQDVNYYAISVEKSRAHKLYNEAVKKVWSPPVKVNALVLWDNPSTASTAQGLDAKYNCDVYFHTTELNERNVLPKEGDFVEFGQVFFEITSVTQPQIVFGQINNKIMTKCACVPAREGNFQAGNNSSENIDNSHPVSQSVYEKK